MRAPPETRCGSGPVSTLVAGQASTSWSSIRERRETGASTVDEWVAHAGDPVPWASRLQARPGSKALIQIVKGDQTVPDSAAAMAIEPGDSAGRTTTFYRHDPASIASPAIVKNPQPAGRPVAAPLSPRLFTSSGQ